MKKLKIFILFNLFLSYYSINAQNYSHIGGDAAGNIPTVMKAFDNGLYIASKNVSSNGITTAIFSKYNITTGSLIWAKKLDFEAEILDFEFVDPTIIQNAIKSFVLVGKTLPLSSPTAQLDNKSFVIRMDDSGGVIFSKIYNQIGREEFSKIKFHPFPYPFGSTTTNLNNAFYISGIRNTINGQINNNFTTTIYNFSISGTGSIIWSNEYNFNNNSFFSQLLNRGLVSLSSGMLLLLGQNSNSGSGSQLYINPNNGNIISNNESDASQIDYSINDAIEISNNLLVAVGHTVNPVLGRNPGFISIINPSTYFRSFYEFTNLESIKNIYMDKDSNFYVTALTVPGTRGNPNPIRFNNVCKLKINWATNPASFQIIWEKSINDSESEYTQSYLFTNTKLSSLFYCDGRNNTAGYGLLDVYYGSFDMDLSSRCSIRLTDNLTNKAPFQDFSTVRQLKLSVPTAVTGTWSNITYPIKVICSPCNLGINLSNSPLQCFSGVLSLTILGGIGPYSYSWDLDCDGNGIANNTNANYNYTNIIPGQHCIKVIVVDLSTGCSIEKTFTFVAINPSPLTINCQSKILTTLPGKCYSEYQGIISIINPCNLPLSNIYSTLSGATTGVFIGTGLIQFNKGVTTVIVGEVGDPPRILCNYTVTVNDEEIPTIICPNNIAMNGLICDNGVNVSFANPIVKDNCPMVSYTCSKFSESKFSCGNTIVTCTATDMAGNTSTCNFNVDITCNCIELDSSEIECGEIPGEFYFSFFIDNYTGSTLPCTNVMLTCAEAIIQSGYIITPLLNGGFYVQGVLIANSPSPTSFNIIATLDCMCGPNLQKFSCTDNIILIAPCCKKVILDSNKICKDELKYTVNLNFSEPIYNISAVEWYFKCGDCSNSIPYKHYATTFDPYVCIYPSSIDCPENKICIYAVVHLDDGTCSILYSNSTTIVFCKPKCFIDTFSTCYTGVLINNVQLHLTPYDTCCVKEIEWYDPEGNHLSSFSNHWTLDVPPFDFTGLPTDCKEIKKYKAMINTVCGVDSCFGTVILYNGLIANGSLSMDPLEFPGPPYCPGDFTLKYTPTCPDLSEHPTWSWYSGFPLGSVVALGPLAGNMNGSLNTNFMNNDTYYQVRSTNGVCPEQKIDYFLDMRQVLKSLNFSALSNSCIDGPVTLTETFGVVTCPVIIDWYRNGILIHTSTYNSSPATYSYSISPAIDYSGNYYCIIKSTCCDVVSKSNISTINHPMVVGIQAPCYTCSALESIKYTAVVENPFSGSCTYAWQKQVGSFWVPNFPLPTTNNMFITNSKKVRVKVSCGPCMKIVEKSVSSCKTKPIIIDIPDITISIPTSGNGGNNFQQVYTCGSNTQVEFKVDSRDTFPEPGTVIISGNLNINEDGISDIIWQLEDEKNNIIKEGYLEIRENEDSFTIKDIIAKELKLDQNYRLRITGYYEEDSVTCSLPFILKSIQDCCKSDSTFENIVESAISLTFDDKICKAKINISGLPQACNIELVSVKWGDGAVSTGSYGNGDMIMHSYAPANVSYLIFIDVVEYDANGKICNRYTIRKIITPICEDCCNDKDYKKFKSLINQGFNLVVNDCEVTVTAPQFGKCFYFGSAPDFGDGPVPPTLVTNPSGTWTHTYNHNGTYNICVNVFAYDDGDTNNICWFKQMCTPVKVDACDSICRCNGFTNLSFHWDKTNNIPVKCNETATLICPPMDCAWSFTGELNCKGDCKSNNLDWKLVNQSTLIPVASGTTMTYPNFGIYIPPHIVAIGGNYQLILTGHCDQNICPCVINLILPGCIDPCPCDPQDLINDVNAGIDIITTLPNCTVCFQPKQLQDCDMVNWYLISNPNTPFATSLGNQTICHKFTNGGNHKIKMQVIRKKSGGQICDDFEKLITINVNCFGSPNKKDEISSCNIGTQLRAGILGDDGYSDLWSSISGEPKLINDPGKTNSWYLKLAGNLNRSDAIYTSSPICLESDDVELRLKYRIPFAENLKHGSKIKICLSSDPINKFINKNPFANMNLFNVANFKIPEHIGEWIEYSTSVNLSRWKNELKCLSSEGKQGYVIIYVENEIGNNLRNSLTELEITDICIDQSTIETSTNEDTKYQFTVFPNPTQSEFIFSQSSDQKLRTELFIYNQMGQLVDQFQLTSTQHNLNFGKNYISGFYILKTKMGNKTHYTKLIKQSH
ncbi:MAG: HYR domain-containing protein [Saprospiraceae bacterium]|nr:HYR domain-containing protein [Saprospiraceae bacterium]